MCGSSINPSGQKLRTNAISKEERGHPSPPAQPSLGNTSAIPRERRQRTDSFSTQAGSCSDDKLLLLLPEISTPLPLPGIRPRKTCSRGNSPQAFLLTWLGREEGDLFVGEIRNKVSGGCDLWQRWEEKKRLKQHHYPNHPALESRGQEGLSKARSSSWWYVPVIPALWSLRQANQELEASLGHKQGPIK